MDGERDSGHGDDEEAGPAGSVLPFDVVTFNTGRFFDTTCDSGACGPDDYELQPSAAEFDFRADQIADALVAADADIILLQEVESQAALDALAQRLPEYETTAFGEIGGAATLDVAFLGRDVEHLETRKHRAETTLDLGSGRTRRFARELLEVHFEFGGRHVVTFVTHFKAKRDDDPEWRLAEAEAARAIAVETQDEFPGALVLLGGDLNDEPGSAPLNALLSDGGFRLATESLADEEAWTYRYFGDELSIDHVLYLERSDAAVATERVEVLRNAGGTFGGSDHAAVRAGFDLEME